MTRKVLNSVREILLGIGIGIIADIGTYRASLWPFDYPFGTIMRPTFEGWQAAIFILVAWFIGAPLCILGIRPSFRAHRYGWMVLACVGLFLNLITWQLHIFVFEYFAAQRHITLEQ